MSKCPAVLAPTENDIQLLLAAQVHLGTKNLDVGMAPYVWKRRNDGIHVINMARPGRRLSSRPVSSLPSRTPPIVPPSSSPSTLELRPLPDVSPPVLSPTTSPAPFREPRLIIVTDPRTDHQPVKEASYVNIPVIAFADTDSPLKYIDVAIPGNNKGKHAIGLGYWLLAREVLRLRGTIPRTTPWSVMTDMFFYRDPDEAEKEAETAAAEKAAEWWCHRRPPLLLR
ncbi:ribosomal protein S2, flavodoxin-like domain-containing protein [Chytridium lagenaria]|nr:ribosomal protein S2, flavodoxin-like domain-containing protein [Chytridium lagenaria]